MKRFALAVLLAAFAFPARAQLLPQYPPRTGGFERLYRGDAAAPRPILLAQASGPAQAAPSSVLNVTPPAGLSTVPLWTADLGKGYAFQVGSPAQIASINVVALRDYYNGQWLIGYGHEVAYFYRNGDQIAYFDVWNVFNTGDAKGVFGASMGVHPCAAAYQTVGALFHDAQSFDANLPPWAQNVNRFTSLELGAGYRPFSNPTAVDGTKRLALIVGGEVNVPFASLFGITGSL